VGVFKWVWGHLRKYRYRMLAGFLLVLGVSVMNTVVPKIEGIRVPVASSLDIDIVPFSKIANRYILKFILNNYFEWVDTDKAGVLRRK